MQQRNASPAVAAGAAVVAGLFAIAVAAYVTGVTNAPGLLIMAAFFAAPIAGLVAYSSRRRLQFASLTLLLRNRDWYEEAFSRMPNDQAIEGCRPLVQACRMLGHIDPNDVVAMRLEVQEGRFWTSALRWLRQLSADQRAAVPASLGGSTQGGFCVVSVTTAVGPNLPLQGMERAPVKEVFRCFMDAPAGSIAAWNWFHAPVHGGDEAGTARLMTALPHLSLPAARR